MLSAGENEFDPDARETSYSQQLNLVGLALLNSHEGDALGLLTATDYNGEIFSALRSHLEMTLTTEMRMSSLFGRIRGIATGN